MFKVAIWSAVSTISQAREDKVSLQDQVERGMNVIQSRGWSHVGSYIISGQSRTAYISLSHAEEAIPELHQLLEDASRGKFNILFVYDLNRFRNLMLQIFEVLCDYNIQIYNYTDPTQIVEPEAYTAERKNAARLNIKLHDIISGSEINQLQKQYRDKMPARITVKKLHAGLGLPPYGYQKPPHLRFDPNAVLEQIPTQVRVLHMMKDWFLNEGCSLTEIADRLNQKKIPPARKGKWWYTAVSYMLANPFYAGIVSFGETERQLDKRKQTVTRIKGKHPVTAQGVHRPIWDTATYQRILDEIERRAKAQPGITIRPFSRLLHCQCSAVLWAQATPAGQYWHCSASERSRNKHTYINNKKALDIVINAIVQSVKERGYAMPKSKPDDEQRGQLEKEIKELKAKQTRWLDLYEDGTLDKPTLNKRLDDIKTRLDRAQNLLQNLHTESTRRQALQIEFKEFAKTIDILPDYIKNTDPKRVNTILHRYIKGITITKKHEVQVHWH